VNDPLEPLERAESLALLAAAIAQLPEDERQVLTLYFDLERTGETLTQEEIKDRLGLCRNRVQRCLYTAIYKLRDNEALMKDCGLDYAMLQRIERGRQIPDPATARKASPRGRIELAKEQASSPAPWQ